MGDFNHHHLLERHHSRHRQGCEFLECTDDSFMMQVTRTPVRGAALQDFILKKELVGSIRVGNLLDCSDNEMMET